MDEPIKPTDIRKLKKDMTNTLYLSHPVTNERIVAEMRIATEFELSFGADILNDNNKFISDYIIHQLHQRVDMPLYLTFGVMKSISKRSYPTHELSFIEISFTAEETTTSPVSKGSDSKNIQKFSEYILAFFEEK